MPELFTVSQVARRLGVPARRVTIWREYGLLGHVPVVANRALFTEETVRMAAACRDIEARGAKPGQITPARIAMALAES